VIPPAPTASVFCEIVNAAALGANVSDATDCPTSNTTFGRTTPAITIAAVPWLSGATSPTQFAGVVQLLFKALPPSHVCPAARPPITPTAPAAKTNPHARNPAVPATTPPTTPVFIAPVVNLLPPPPKATSPTLPVYHQSLTPPPSSKSARPA
jgi:hypothetical protein